MVNKDNFWWGISVGIVLMYLMGGGEVKDMFFFKLGIAYFFVVLIYKIVTGKMKDAELARKEAGLAKKETT